LTKTRKKKTTNVKGLFTFVVHLFCFLNLYIHLVWSFI